MSYFQIISDIVSWLRMILPYSNPNLQTNLSHNSSVIIFTMSLFFKRDSQTYPNNMLTVFPREDCKLNFFSLLSYISQYFSKHFSFINLNFHWTRGFIIAWQKNQRRSFHKAEDDCDKFLSVRLVGEDALGQNWRWCDGTRPWSCPAFRLRRPVRQFLVRFRGQIKEGRTHLTK